MGGGSKALGVCIRQHREPRTQKVLADAMGRSTRWLVYAEAGRTDVTWSDLIAITTVLGRAEGRAFLAAAIDLLYQEAEVAGAPGEGMGAGPAPGIVLLNSGPRAVRLLP